MSGLGIVDHTQVYLLPKTYRFKTKKRRKRDKSANAKEKFETLWDVVLYMTNIRPGSGASSVSSAGSSGRDIDDIKKEVIEKWKAK